MVFRGEVYGVSWRSLWCFVEKSMVFRGEVYGVSWRSLWCLSVKKPEKSGFSRILNHYTKSLYEIKY